MMRAFAVLAGLVLAAAVGTAHAHTFTIGWVNSGPGSVTIWFGSYHDCSEAPPHEGSFNIVGTGGNSFPSTTVPFTLSSSTKPAGLVDGTTNFYATNSNTLAASDVDNIGPANCWQGVTFTNLVVGTYQFTYIPVANPTAKWAPWNSAVTTSSETLTAGVVQAGPALEVPTLDPMMLALLALAVGAVALGSRRLG